MINVCCRHLTYLVLIEQIDLLPRLYGGFVIPESVLDELSAVKTPQLVHDWVTKCRLLLLSLMQA